MHKAVYKVFKVNHISNGFYAKAFGKLITNVRGGLLGAGHMAAIPALRRQRQEDGRMGRLENLEPAWAVTN